MRMRSRKERIKQLLESTLNEVRLPTGYFLILNRFTVQASDKEWATVFQTNEVVHLDPNNNTVRGYNPTLKRWNEKDISFSELRKPEQYKVFTDNSRRLTPAEVKERGFSDALEFSTTVRALPKRAVELDLDPGTKLNVKVID